MKTEEQYETWLSEQQEHLKDRKEYTKNFVGERGYKHFDSAVSLKDASKYEFKSEACDFEKLKRHKFWPFIRVDKMTRRFTRDQEKRIVVKHKNRHLMYASHLDAVIMAFYAWILKSSYEHKIRGSLADASVIGYRKIPKTTKNDRGKSNIDFAFDIYQRVLRASDAVILCIDIEDFFGNINHNLLTKKVYPFIPEGMLGHFLLVLKPITKYRYIFKHDIERKLGRKQKWNNSRRYNSLIKNAGIIHKNHQEKGIPQGSPISDILANIYLYDFDVWLAEKIKDYPGAFYRRYSDDIILIVPQSVSKKIYKELRLKLKEEFKVNVGLTKTEAFQVDVDKGIFNDITNEYTPKNYQYCKKKNAMQYLGFLMNLDFFMLRPGTIANYYRKEIAYMKRFCIAKFGKKNVEIRRGTIKAQPITRRSYYKAASKKSNTVARQVHHMKRRTKRLKRNTCL